MQDKTINNALRQLYVDAKRGDGAGVEHILALMKLRGVEPPNVVIRDAPVAKRGAMQRMVLDALRDGPKTRKQIVAHIAPMRPDVPPERLYWRVDAALAKVRDVVEGGPVWRLPG